MSNVHVVMIVGNDIRRDTRVKRTAASLVRAGYQVTVVGRSLGDEREQSELAGAAVIRVPVPWRDRNRRASGVGRVRAIWRSERAAKKLQARFSHPALWPARLAVRVLRGLGRRVERRQIASGTVSWRRWAPGASDYLRCMTPEIVALRPDIIYAHDVQLLAVAHRAVSRLTRRGNRVAWLYDAHEYVAGLSLYQGRTEYERAAWLALEKQFITKADRVVTVSPDLARRLQDDYQLPQLPDVVINAPWYEAKRRPLAGVRGDCALPDETPLLVYSGGMTEARGVLTAIAALPALPQVHLALVPTPPRGAFLSQAWQYAVELGVADRVHISSPVHPQDVVAHLATADIGLIPLHRFASHDVALTNKLFEYLHAGLPVVVSDCPAQEQFVNHLQIGAVHRAADPESFAAAVMTVLSQLPKYRNAVTNLDLSANWSWQHSEQVLISAVSALRPPGRPAELSAEFPALREEVVLDDALAPQQVITGGALRATGASFDESEEIARVLRVAQLRATGAPVYTTDPATALLFSTARLVTGGEEVEQAATNQTAPGQRELQQVIAVVLGGPPTGRARHTIDAVRAAVKNHPQWTWDVVAADGDELQPHRAAIVIDDLSSPMPTAAGLAALSIGSVLVAHCPARLARLIWDDVPPVVDPADRDISAVLAQLLAEGTGLNTRGAAAAQWARGRVAISGGAA